MTTVRCSSLPIARYCPGAPALLARESPETDETRTGTIAHEWIRRYLETDRPSANEWLLECRPDLFDELQDFAEWFEETLLPKIDLEAARFEYCLQRDLGEGLSLIGHLDVLAFGCEERIVIDWKHGAGQRWILPAIEDDYQMLGYAILGSFCADPVRVLRVLVSDLEYSEMTLDREQLADSADEIADLLVDVAADPEHRTPGPHCDHCLARTACPERFAATEAVHGALVPYSGELALTRDQATQWALHRGAIRDRCDQLDVALRRAIEAGQPIEAGGKRLALVGSGSRDKVTDARGAIAELRAMIGDAADQAISTSKGALERACKAAGIDGGAFIEALRVAGAIKAEPTEKAIRWVKA